MHKPRTVNGILRKIEEKADTGEYLYRGEPNTFRMHRIVERFPLTSIVFSLMTETLMLKRNTLI